MYYQRILHIFLWLPPLTWGCASFMTGIATYVFTDCVGIPIAACVFFSICSAYYLQVQKDLGGMYLMQSVPFFFALGVLIPWHQYHSHATATKLITGSYDELIGTVSDITPIEHPRFTQVIKLCPVINNCATNATCALYTTGRSNLCADDLILIKKIKLQQPRDADFNRYCIKEGINATGCINLRNAALVHRPLVSLSRFLWQLKTAVFKRLRSKISPTSFTFFSSFFLGNRKINKKENDRLKKWCKFWGISHYLARSGLHLVIFIMGWEYLIRFIPISFIFKQFLLLILTLIYFALSWTSISFIRALTTLFFFKLCVIFGTHQNTVAGITLVTLAILIFNPWQLFFLDFQLSFGITYLLGCMTHYQTINRNSQQAKP